jgi:cell division septation protein DedD
MLRVALAFGLIVSLLLLGISVLSSRSLARAAEHDEPSAAELDEPPAAEEEGPDDEGAEEEAEEQPLERLTRELQALQPALDVGVYQETPPTIDEDTESAADQDADVAAAQDTDVATDQEKDLAAYFESQEAMRQRRDELKARAREAELRVKKLEAELHTAPSTPKSEQ